MPTFGVVLTWGAFASALISVAIYIAATFSKSVSSQKLSEVARGFFVLAFLFVVGVAVIHSTLLMTHRFDVAYVYNYSARQLAPFYLFATFWAGQEGSILLWAFWTSVLGVVLAFTAGKQLQAKVMSVYGVIVAFLLLLLVVKSPFAPYVPINPGDPLHPTNGQGLNPLLENPWMVVHPPTLFLGLSSLAATFSYAVAALIWGDLSGWYKKTWPWALFSFAVLGFGIMLGGYWAYETLGWGGFWGWDPVENGPLVAWLGMIAFLHTAQVQHVRGALKKSTLFLGLFPMCAALYETFLTRTGILDKFSNHSFSTLGGIANSLILYGLLASVAAAVGLLLWRRRQVVNDSDAWDNASSREFAMTMATIILMCCAVITGAGMSAPLITQAGVALHLTSAQSSVSPGFYNKANFPVAILLAIGMAVGPYLAWRSSSAQNATGLLWPYICAVAAAGLFCLFYLVVFVGMHMPHYASISGGELAVMVLLFAACMFAVVANAIILFKRIAPSGHVAAGAKWTLGSAVSHIGAAVLLIGVVCLVTFTRSDEPPILVQGHPRTLDNLGYTLTLEGMTSTMKDPNNALKFDVASRDGRDNFKVLMPLAIRNVEGHFRILARPAIFQRWWGDLYFALKDGPEQFSPTPLQHVSLTMGTPTKIDGYTLMLGKFSVPPATAAKLSQGEMPDRVVTTALIGVRAPNGTLTTVSPTNVLNAIDPIENSPEVLLPKATGKDPMALGFDKMDVDSGNADFYIRDASAAPVTSYVVDVSTRPMISLVWIGTILITLGGLISMRRRAVELRAVEAPSTTGSSAPEAIPQRRRRVKYGHSQERKPAAVAMRSSK